MRFMQTLKPTGMVQMPRKVWATKKDKTKAPMHTTRTFPLDEGRTLHLCVTPECEYKAVVDWTTKPFTTTEIRDPRQSYATAHRLLKEVISA